MGATLKIKMKGKSKCEIEITTDEEGNEHRKTKSKTKLKKIIYILMIDNIEFPLEFDEVIGIAEIEIGLALLLIYFMMKNFLKTRLKFKPKKDLALLEH